MNFETFFFFLVNSLQGWMGVFIVTLIIIALVYLFNFLFSGRE